MREEKHHLHEKNNKLVLAFEGASRAQGAHAHAFGGSALGRAACRFSGFDGELAEEDEKPLT